MLQTNKVTDDLTTTALPRPFKITEINILITVCFLWKTLVSPLNLKSGVTPKAELNSNNFINLFYIKVNFYKKYFT